MSLHAPFEKAILDLVKSVNSIEEFSEYLVRSAVTEALACVSDKYGLDTHLLVAEFVEPLVKKHAHVTVPCHICKAITCRGKKCTKVAVLDGYCQLHGKQLGTAVGKKRIRSRDTEDTVTKVMRLLTSVKKMSAEGR